MKYVVMVSHGEFAPGLHSAVKMMTEIVKMYCLQA